MTALDTLDITVLFDQILLQRDRVTISALPHTRLNVMKL
jgi:hypothetical protein